MLLTSEIQNQGGERGQKGRHVGAMRAEGENVNTLSQIYIELRRKIIIPVSSHKHSIHILLIIHKNYVKTMDKVNFFFSQQRFKLNILILIVFNSKEYLAPFFSSPLSSSLISVRSSSSSSTSSLSSSWLRPGVGGASSFACSISSCFFCFSSFSFFGRRPLLAGGLGDFFTAAAAVGAAFFLGGVGREAGLFLAAARREGGDSERENDMAAEPEADESREKRLGVAEEEEEEAEGCGELNACEARVFIADGVCEARGPWDSSMAFRISGC